MAFCKFSNQLVIKNSTAVDNAFLNEYLPYAPESAVKVYLYGLYKCQNAESYDNTLEYFAKILHMTPDDVKDCFLYWQDQGLVTVIEVNPIEVRYLPVTYNTKITKFFSKSKFSDFNKQAQELLEGRIILPTEYNEYYTFLESMHMEPAALTMIIQYCINLKGTSVSYPYILTVAKNWAYEGILTTENVELKLRELELVSGEIKELLKILNIKRKITYEDNQYYSKWTKKFGFDKEVILEIAKNNKKLLNKTNGIAKLDTKFSHYYELKLYTVFEIETYENNKDSLIKSAKEITRTLGLYYENVENVIEVYLTVWQTMGYTINLMKQIADYCFKHSIKSLEGMDQTVRQFYAKGLITEESIAQYFNDILQSDAEIKALLAKLNLTRLVTSWDRDFYRTWTYSWNFSKDMIDYACELSVGKIQPITYMNKILSNWKQNNINSLEGAKQFAINFVPTSVQPKKEFALQRSYTPEEINALFDNLDEVKLK